MPDLHGTLRVEGSPVAGQLVLAYDRPGGALLATATSGDDGKYTLALPDTDASVTLLARFVGEVNGAIARRVAAPLSKAVDLELSGPLPVVRVLLDGGPGRAVVFADAAELSGVPAELAPFLSQRATGVFDSAFVERDVRGTETAFVLAPGTWRLGARLQIDGPAEIRVDPESWGATSAVDADSGAELPGERYSGFELTVSGDRAVTLRMTAV
jgi:hypothetical protein